MPNYDWRLKKDIDTLSGVIFRLQRLALEGKRNGHRHLQNETQGVANSLKDANNKLRALLEEIHAS